MAQNNNNMYPGLTDEQIKRLEEVISGLTGAGKESARTQIYSAVLKKNQEEKWDNDRTEAKNELRFRGMTNQDQPTGTSQISSANLETLVDIAKKKRGSDPKQDSGEVFSGIVSMARDKHIKEETLDNYLNHLDPEFLYQMGFEDRPEQNYALQNNLGTLKDWGIGAGIGLGVAGTKTFGNIAKSAYGITIPTSQKDKFIKYSRDVTPKEIDRYNKEIADREKIIAEAEKNPKYTESMKQSIREKYGAEIDSLRQTVNDAENRLDRAIDTPTTAESAYKYGVKGSTVDSIGKKAMEEANVLWNAGVKLKLDTSKQTLNLKALLDGININELAKDKTELKGLEEALETMKTLYKDAEYGNMSMAAANDFKSNLYDKIPPKAFEGKNVSAFNKVITAISQSVKNATQQMLTQEFGEDAAKQYKEWANLHAIQESSMLEGVGKSNLVERSLMNKLTSLVQAVTNPLFSEGGYYASKLNEQIRGGLGKAKDAVKGLVNTVKENPVSAIKEGVKGLTREMPATVIMDEMIKNQEYIQDNPMAQKANAFNAVSESQWSKLANKSEVEELLKTSEFREAADNLGLDLQNLAKKFKINSKEVNATVDKQNKQKAEDNKNRLSLSAKIENENKKNKPQNSTINQLNKTASLKSQKTTVGTKKKSGK